MSRILPFEVPSSDGYPLRGKIHLPDDGPAPGVLLVHGFKGFMDWGFWPLLGEALAEAGLAACRFNLSGSGVGEDGETFSEKERFETNTHSREVEDVLLMADLLARGEIPGAATRAGEIGLLGHSRGGGAAILAAANDPNIASLVTWASIATVQRFSDEQIEALRKQGYFRVENARTGDVFHIGPGALDDIENKAEDLDILSAAASLEIPTLVVHGTVDEAVPFAESLALISAFADSTFLRVDGAGHTFGATHPMPDSIPLSLEMVINASVDHIAESLNKS
jgi:uncharacterized protein